MKTRLHGTVLDKGDKQIYGESDARFVMNQEARFESSTRNE